MQLIRSNKLGIVTGNSIVFTDNKVTVKFPLPSKNIILYQIQIPVVMNVDGSTVFSSSIGEAAAQVSDPLFNLNFKFIASPSGQFSSGTATITFTWVGSVFLSPTNYIQIQLMPGSQYSSLVDASKCLLIYEVLE